MSVSVYSEDELQIIEPSCLVVSLVRLFLGFSTT